MASGITDKKKWLWGGALGAVALVAMMASGSNSSDLDASAAASDALLAEEPNDVASGYAARSMEPGGYQQANFAQDGGGGPPSERQGDAGQALEGLAQIRQQQCQSGNNLACQALPTIPGIRQQLAQFDQGCRSGDRRACDSYDSLAQRIYTAYSESAAVMRAGEQGMAQMDAWRAQMNRNAANSMANLRAQAARGQAAHEARQESYAAMNRSWEAGQDSIDRGHGRFVDQIYEGTTMDGGGVQSRIDNGSVGYTDGYGNVIAVPEGREPPDGWQRMNPTYAEPQ